MTNRLRTAKKLLKIVAYTTGIYLLLLFVASLYVNSQKEKLIAYIIPEIHKRLHGKATIGDIKLNVWRYFPRIAVSIKDLSLVDTVYQKPVFFAGSIYTTFSIPGLLSSQKKLSNIHIHNGSFHLFKDANGYSNYYLLKPRPLPVNKDSNRKESNAAVDISSIVMNNFSVIIEDKPANKEISLQVDKLRAGLQQMGNSIAINMKEHITMKKGLGFNLAKGSYLQGQTLEAAWQLVFNKKTKTLSFDKTELEIDGHPLMVNGHFVFGAVQPSFAIFIDAKELPYEIANKIVTAAIRKKTGLVQLKEPLDVHGSVIGSLLPHQEPAVDMSWQTTNNVFTTPVATFSKCSFAGNFMNSVHKDSLHNDPNSKISFSHFSGNWDGVMLEGKDIAITNLEKPQLRFVFHSNCELKALENKFALKDISFKGGHTSLSLMYDGPLSTDNSMMQGMEGKFEIKNGEIEYVPRNFSFTQCNGNIGFFKDSISLQNFSCQYRNNKLAISVDGRNIRRKFVANDVSQSALIHCSVSSPHINLEDFETLFAPAKQRTKKIDAAPTLASTSKLLDETLTNSVIAVDLKAANVKHKKLLAKNFDASIKFYPRHWEVQNMSVGIAGGTISTNGKMTNLFNGTHAATIMATVKNVDVQKLLYAFNNFQQDAITDKHLRGIFSATANLHAGVTSQGKIIPSSVMGKVDFSLKNGVLQNFPPFEKMKKFVFKNRDMSNVKFAEIKNTMDVKGTDVFVNRMEVHSSVCRFFVQGNYGLKGKNTDMLIQVPLSNLDDSNFTDGVAPKNKSGNAKVGMSMWLRAENDEAGNVKMKLTFRKKLKDAQKNEQMQKSMEADKKKK